MQNQMVRANIPLNTILWNLLLSSERIIPHLVCMDGFKMSVQMNGNFHYSQIDVHAKQIISCEIALLSQHEDLLNDYVDGNDVFSYIPFEVVEKIVEKHGGLSHFEAPYAPDKKDVVLQIYILDKSKEENSNEKNN